MSEDQLVDEPDPVRLARDAGAACARISLAGPVDPDRLPDVLTELYHVVRMVRDAAEGAAGKGDEEVRQLSWQFAAAIGTNLTPEPIPVLRPGYLDQLSP